MKKEKSGTTGMQIREFKIGDYDAVMELRRVCRLAYKPRGRDSLENIRVEITKDPFSTALPRNCPGNRATMGRNLTSVSFLCELTDDNKTRQWDGLFSKNFQYLAAEKRKRYFLRKIREWGRRNLLHYPWREEENLFRLLLTEIFLQKTDSAKVKELYPLIKGIEGPQDMLDNEKTLDYMVSKIGLSYKKERILYLSRQLLEKFNGQVPPDYQSLRTLKGVGDYIANAVLAFGFKKKAALVDTNTIRIVESFFGYRSDKKRARDDRGINEFLLSLLPQRDSALFNYYLLDFGALVCTRYRRKCAGCTLKRNCSYFHLKGNGA